MIDASYDGIGGGGSDCAACRRVGGGGGPVLLLLFFLRGGSGVRPPLLPPLPLLSRDHGGPGGGASTLPLLFFRSLVSIAFAMAACDANLTLPFAGGGARACTAGGRAWTAASGLACLCGAAAGRIVLPRAPGAGGAFATTAPPGVLASLLVAKPYRFRRCITDMCWRLSLFAPYDRLRRQVFTCAMRVNAAVAFSPMGLPWKSKLCSFRLASSAPANVAPPSSPISFHATTNSVRK
mmetsp:Transcript_1248/g.2375  ORF Transcript_1248/g.2375 Transcript_1248/m.2375 type:complete len:237 (-) Transcript_1248:605-1315(-)